MTTKTLTGYYPTGYWVPNTISGVTITNTATLNGSPGSYYQPKYINHSGYAGLEMDYPARAYNYGLLRGGAGGAGAAAYHDTYSNQTFAASPGTGGGEGVLAKAGVYMVNRGFILGGPGGNGGAGDAALGEFYGGSGGSGGAGVHVAGAGAFVYNPANHHITGGLGGAGGYGPHIGGIGGYGGYGVYVGIGASVSNYGFIYGGVGGKGGTGGSQGGDGGTGGIAALIEGGTLINRGYIFGGSGGAASTGGAAGKPGAGARLYDGLLENDSGFAGGYTISGFTGVYVSGGVLTNFGTIDGTGGTSVEFFTANARLIVESGAVFLGSVSGDGATVEFANSGGTFSLGPAGPSANGISFASPGFATYQLDAGSWTMSGSNTIAAGQTLQIGAGAAVQMTGAIANAGAIALANGGSFATVFVGAAGATLSGAGHVMLSGPHARILGLAKADTLTNVDNTISGAGFFGLGQMTFVNKAAGVVDANTAGVLIVRTDGETLTNGGLVEATGLGHLEILNTTVGNIGGTVAAASVVSLVNSDIVGGSIATSGSSFVGVNSLGCMVDGSGGHAVSLTGRIILADNSALTIAGALADKAGSITVTGGNHLTRLLVAAAGATLSGGGTILLTNRVNNLNLLDAAAAGAKLTNVDNRIIGAGMIGDASGELTLVNKASGYIASPYANGLTIDTGANKIINAGRIDGTGGGGMTIKSALENDGRIDALNGNLTVLAAVTGTGFAGIQNATMSFGSSFNQNVTFLGATPSGTLQLAKSQGYTTGVITGFSHSGSTKLDLRDIGFVSASEASWNQSTHILTVSDGSHTALIHLAGSFTNGTSDFFCSTDGAGGTTVIDPTRPAALARPGG